MSSPTSTGGASEILGRPIRLLAMDILLYLLGVPLVMIALLAPWEALLRGLALIAGIAAVGVGIYVAHGTSIGKARRG